MNYNIDWNSDEYWGIVDESTVDNAKLLENNFNKMSSLISQFIAPKIKKTVDCIHLEWFNNAACIEITLTYNSMYRIYSKTPCLCVT